MTNFTYDNTVPATNNNPSVDQPDMLINAQSIDSIWTEDHIGFNATDGGTHKFMRITSNPNYIVPPAPATNNSAVFFTTAGVANINAAAAKFRNINLTFPLNLVKAWAFVTGSGVMDASQSFNVTSVTRTAAGRYNVVLAANVVSNSTFGVIISVACPIALVEVANYVITGTGTFSINISRISGVFIDPDTFNFMVIQL